MLRKTGFNNSYPISLFFGFKSGLLAPDNLILFFGDLLIVSKPPVPNAPVTGQLIGTGKALADYDS